MYIKEIHKAEKTYYVLVIIEKSTDGKKKFYDTFISPKIAKALEGAGIVVKKFN